jgi:hypothetical protein
MHPIGFVKAHPLATVVLLATGAIALPAALNMLGSRTGINVSLPSMGGGD